MKVVHVLKRIEMIDQDIKELRKLEKSIAKDKSFSTPIYMSIEKQINIMLGERIKMLELKIENPPSNLVEEIEGKKEEDKDEEVKAAPKAKAKPKAKAAPKPKPKKAPAKKPAKKITLEDDDIPMLTQDDIDAKFSKASSSKSKEKTVSEKSENSARIADGDDNVKLLDIALQKGTLDKKEIEKEKERKVRFFRENFPSE